MLGGVYNSCRKRLSLWRIRQVKILQSAKSHLLECSRIEIFIPKYYTAFYKKAHTQTYRVLLFPTQAQMFAHRIIFSKKTVNTAQLVEKVRFRARCAQRIKSRRMARGFLVASCFWRGSTERSRPFPTNPPKARDHPVRFFRHPPPPLRGGL